jgi:hypothetical protein
MTGPAIRNVSESSPALHNGAVVIDAGGPDEYAVESIRRGYNVSLSDAYAIAEGQARIAGLRDALAPETNLVHRWRHTGTLEPDEIPRPPWSRDGADFARDQARAVTAGLDVDTASDAFYADWRQAAVEGRDHVGELVAQRLENEVGRVQAEIDAILAHARDRELQARQPRRETITDRLTGTATPDPETMRRFGVKPGYAGL